MEKFASVYNEIKPDIDLDWNNNQILKDYEKELDKFKLGNYNNNYNNNL